MSSAMSQISCFSSIVINSRSRFHTRSYPHNFRSVKVLNVMSSNLHGAGVSNLENKTTSSYVEDASTSHIGNSVKSYPVTDGFAIGEATSENVQEQFGSRQVRAAKIHDFCLGIPFSGIVLSGRLLGFIFSRNPVTLITGVSFGGALLALSTYSLKTKQLFPTGLNAVISAAMLCFYSHVVIAGGNPPPKKLKSRTAVESS